MTRSHASAHESVADIPHTVTHAFAVGSCLFSLFVSYIENEREKKERSEREREFCFCLFVRSCFGKSERFKNWGNRRPFGLFVALIHYSNPRDRIERSTAFHSMISLHPSGEDEYIPRERTQEKKKEGDFLRARERGFVRSMYYLC